LEIEVGSPLGLGAKKLALLRYFKKVGFWEPYGQINCLWVKFGKEHWRGIWITHIPSTIQNV